MHCPRCGEENEEGFRFCSSCGAELPRPGAEPPEQRSLRERVAGIVGATPRARLLTAGTALALAIAIVAFIALDPPEDDGVPRDAYTIAADGACVDAKRAIAATGERLSEDGGAEGLGRYGSDLLRVTTEWRSTMRSLDVPLDRRAAAREIDVALREVVVQAAVLAQVGRAGNPDRVAEQARRVDEASARVEAAIEELGLFDCARLQLVPGGLARG